MYTAHFGLNATPFSITPDPHYLYLSECHREALAHLLYGVKEGSGFVLLTGEVGTGKTTLCRCLIEQLAITVDVALLSNPQVSPRELLVTLFDDLRISYTKNYTIKDFIDTLNAYLLTAHAVRRQTVLILDEAQNLSTEVLEQVRLLTNLETANRRLLQIILVGQPELKKIIQRKNLRQLEQRITARYHLLPLSMEETAAYINHRLTVSGSQVPLFSKRAMRRIYAYSGGIPRLINIICDRALLGGYVKGQNFIDIPIVHKAVEEVRGENYLPLLSWWMAYSPWSNWMLGMIGVLIIGGVWWMIQPSLKSVTELSSTTSEESATVKEITIPAAVATTIVRITSPTRSDNVPQNIEKPTTTATTQPLTTPVQPTSNLLELLSNPEIFKDIESAFTTLFRQWQLNYAQLAGNTGCERAATQGFACVYKSGSWEDIRSLNRPAIIELVTDEAGKERYHMVVTRLQEGVATLDFSGQKFNLPISEINKFWLGQFLLIWQPPALPVPTLAINASGNGVVWIRKRLNAIEGRASEVDLSPRFDAALQRRVKNFQQQHGLFADGIVGEQTMLALDSLIGEPLLSKKNE